MDGTSMLIILECARCVFADPTLRALTGADQLERDKREVRRAALCALSLYWLPLSFP